MCFACCGDLERSSITAGAFSPDSLEMAVGTSGGKCLIFDLRSSRPLLQFEHRNFAAVNTLQWLRPPAATVSAAAAVEDPSWAAPAKAAPTAVQDTAHTSSGGRRVASCDGVSIKVWSASAASCISGSNARLLASIEAPLVWENPVAPRNDKVEQQQLQRQKEQQQQRVVRFSSFTFYGDSGLVLASTDHRQMGAYFLPSIGLAPKYAGIFPAKLVALRWVVHTLYVNSTRGLNALSYVQTYVSICTYMHEYVWSR